jgi:hypothetical protein
MSDKEESTWLTVLWSLGIMMIGTGFAICRYIQFFTHGDTGFNPRITRIELYIYRGVGPWGVVAAFSLMAVAGLYYTIYHYRAVTKKKRPL